MPTRRFEREALAQLLVAGCAGRADIIHHDVRVFDLNHAFSDEARRIAVFCL